jgi:hypothetical protein
MMKTMRLLLVIGALAVLSLNSFAAGPYGSKPTCPMGQFPKLEYGSWRCQDIRHKANDHSMDRAIHQPHKMQNDMRHHGYHDPQTIRDPKPKCPLGQIPGYENHQWVCRQPGRASEMDEQPQD